MKNYLFSFFGFKKTMVLVVLGLIALGSVVYAGNNNFSSVGHSYVDQGRYLFFRGTDSGNLGPIRGFLFGRNDSPHFRIKTLDGQDMSLGDGGSDNLFIKGRGGYVGIGTKNPKAKLDVGGNTKIHGILEVGKNKYGGSIFTKGNIETLGNITAEGFIEADKINVKDSIEANKIKAKEFIETIKIFSREVKAIELETSKITSSGDICIGKCE